MKNISVKIIALVFAFLLGVSFVIIYYFYSIPEISKPELIKPEETFDCVKQNSFPGLSQKISELEKFKNGYFPKKTFTDGWENSDAFTNEWYGKHLKAMGEKSLIKVSDQNPEIYRFLWLRTFHHPIFVRVERTSAHSFDLISRELDGAGGYEPGENYRTIRRSLDENEWCEFIKILAKANYWKLPTNQPDEMGNDGAQWILEGVKDGRYHIVDRWTPQSGEFREACIYLLRLSHIDVDRLKDDLY